MTTIQLVGALPRELKDAGLKTGDKLNAEPSQNSVLGAMLVKVWKEDAEHYVTIWPENFKKIAVS